jgi:hypothetical protein
MTDLTKSLVSGERERDRLPPPVLLRSRFVPRRLVPRIVRRVTNRSDERFTILGDERLDRHRLATTDFSDIVVGAGKDSVAVVDGDFMKMLHQECFRRATGKCTLIAVHDDRGVLSGSLRASAVDFRVPAGT